MFLADPKALLEKHSDLTHAIISNPTINPETIFELLYPETGPPRRNSERFVATPGRVELLHTIALLFARVPHLNPRQAWRKVARVYELFWRNRFHLNQNITPSEVA